MGTEYNKDDVAAALQSALIPAKTREYSIAGLRCISGAGFPSEIIPETSFACWDWFRMDGAKSHLAEATLERLTRVVGCWPDKGPPGEPNARPHIERFFHLIAAHFAHRFPGTVGSAPDSIERALGDTGGDISLYVELSELEDLVHVLLRNYNGTPHTGVGGRTPLEAMAYAARVRGDHLRTLPMPLRSNLCLMQEAKIVPIKGSRQRGVRPHINFLYVTYSSPVLASNAALIGRKVRIYFDVRDIRTVKAFFEDGTELGILVAARPWNITPHSVRVRQEIFKLLAEKKLRANEGECLVTAWAKYKWASAKSSKRAANALAKANQYAKSLEAADSERDPPSPEPAAAVSPHALSGEGIVAPKPMQIRRTITF